MTTLPAASTKTDNDTTPIYFWKENETGGYLCQWYLIAFTAPAHPSSKKQEPMVFTSTEQFMMYNKAMTFHDLNIAAQIMNISNPRQQKAKGRKVRGFDGKMWNKSREKIVEDGNWWKFTAAKDLVKGQELKNLLLQTGDRLLVEASPFDSIWGIGFSATDAGSNYAHWGLNLLGKALMKVRDRIREDDEKAKEEGAKDDKETKQKGNSKEETE